MGDLVTFTSNGGTAGGYLASPASGKGPGVIGFCMGGMLALMTGTLAPDVVGAVVDCYGVPPQKKPDYAKLRGIPVLGIFGGKEEHVMGALPGLEANLKA